MIDPDAVLGVLRALADDLAEHGWVAEDSDESRVKGVSLRAYRDRIVALAEDIGICGAIAPGQFVYGAVQCDLTDGHRGMHSGLDWSGLQPDEVGAPARMHWSSLSGAVRRRS